MAHRHLNLFDGNQSNFTNRDRSNLGGWTVDSSDTSAKRLDKRGFYATYNPNDRATFIKNSLGVYTTATAAKMEVHSPWMSVEPGTLYMFSLMMFAQFGGFNVVLEAQGNSVAADSGATTISTSSAVEFSENTGGKAGLDVSNGAGTGDSSYQFIKVIVRATNSAGGNLSGGSFYVACLIRYSVSTD